MLSAWAFDMRSKLGIDMAPGLPAIPLLSRDMPAAQPVPPAESAATKHTRATTDRDT